MKQIALLFLFNLQFFTVQSQTIDPRTYDYTKVDSIVLSLSRTQFRSIDELSSFINKGFNSDLERLRAIYRWVTNNIEYSFSYRKADVNAVFDAKKAVCNGYSELVKKLCDNSNIRCRKVTGWAKNSAEFTDTIGDKFTHAWNIVTIHGKEYFIEATWGAGGYDVINDKFEKGYCEAYYLTSPEIFILQHLPKDPQEQLLVKKMSKKEFVDSPAFLEGAVINKIRSVSPKILQIITKRRFGYAFSFKSLELINNVEISIQYTPKGSGSDPHAVNIEKNKNGYSFYWDFEDYGNYYAIIRLNGKESIVYKVLVE